MLYDGDDDGCGSDGDSGGGNKWLWSQSVVVVDVGGHDGNCDVDYSW